MFKFLIAIISFFVVTISYSSAEILNNIKVNGNQRISKETIIVLGKIEINSDYDANRLNDTLKDLYDSNFFKNIDLDLNSGILSINVVENFIIENIEITGLKSKTLTDQLAEGISLKNRMSFSEGQLQKDMTLIKNVLKMNGYYFATVESSIVKNNELNSIKLKLNVDQGKRARVKEISFIGDKKVKDKKLLEIIATEEHKFWKFISNKVYLNKSTIELDKRLLENYYKNLGYHKVKILNSFAEFKKDGNFELVFNIEAGDKFFFNDLKLNLPPDYNQADFKKIDKIFSKLKDEECFCKII